MMVISSSLLRPRDGGVGIEHSDQTERADPAERKASGYLTSKRLLPLPDGRNGKEKEKKKVARMPPSPPAGLRRQRNKNW